MRYLAFETEYLELIGDIALTLLALGSSSSVKFVDILFSYHNSLFLLLP